MRWLPLIVASIFSWWPGHHSVVTRPAPVIKSVLTTKKVVALTFDDGPTRTWTPKVLQVLKDNHVKATFFVIGQHATQRPEVLKQEIDSHMEIGSHGFQHLTLRNQSADAVKQEVQQNEALLTSLGVKKPTLYRLPGGSSDSVALKVLGQMGYKVIGWSVDTRDWRRRYTADQLVERVNKTVQPGAIIIFHDGPNSSQATVDAVKKLIPELKQEGYTFDTVGQMLKLEKFGPH
ncbi:polysaccharide deacetylase family protein [Sulfobacillus harzensis]|uniref:Polysaccharide deacetylase family protein n=1 Tax=Sulfobacillus harzensis TaxID=2729629 RepID=A0A7Y0L6Y4_9FIRM|nr:polysaccharide deacetylase family protein [Sulfobacillus harzensis]NMP24067.1 polysaccharide deacetylase family protein [Sulfobacillus harzensis]